MKLTVDVLRYLSKDDFRVLTAVEMGMRNVSFRNYSYRCLIHVFTAAGRITVWDSVKFDWFRVDKFDLFCFSTSLYHPS